MPRHANKAKAKAKAVTRHRLFSQHKTAMSMYLCVFVCVYDTRTVLSLWDPFGMHSGLFVVRRRLCIANEPSSEQRASCSHDSWPKSLLNLK